MHTHIHLHMYVWICASNCGSTCECVTVHVYVGITEKFSMEANAYYMSHLLFRDVKHVCHVRDHFLAWGKVSTEIKSQFSALTANAGTVV